jgi:hypothetical protein
MWEPRRLTPLWVSTACYRDSFYTDGHRYDVHNVIFQHPVSLYRSDLGISVPSKGNVVRCSFIEHYCHYMFQPSWPSSGVRVVMVKDSAAHCNAVFCPPIVVTSGYFWLCGFYVIAFSFAWFTGCSCVESSCWGGSSVMSAMMADQNTTDIM